MGQAVGPQFSAPLWTVRERRTAFQGRHVDSGGATSVGRPFQVVMVDSGEPTYRRTRYERIGRLLVPQIIHGPRRSFALCATQARGASLDVAMHRGMVARVFEPEGLPRDQPQGIALGTRLAHADFALKGHNGVPHRAQSRPYRALGRDGSPCPPGRCPGLSPIGLSGRVKADLFHVELHFSVR
jgi:hypothetical protein